MGMRQLPIIALLSEAADLKRKAVEVMKVLCARPVKVIKATHTSSRFRQTAEVKAEVGVPERYPEGAGMARKALPEPEGVVRESGGLGVRATGLRKQTGGVLL
jgi:hypothetical protein